MKLSDFEKNQILKFLNLNENKVSLNLFQKGQVVSFLNKVDEEINPDLNKEVDLYKNIEKYESDIVPEKEVIIKQEIIKQEISDDKVKEIINTVKSEIKIKNGQDGKNAPSIEELVLALKDDYDFISKLRQYPVWGTGGYGEQDVIRVIDEQRPLNPKLFGPDEDGNWRLIQRDGILYQEYKYNGIWIPQCQCNTDELHDDLILSENPNPIDDLLPIIAEDGTFIVQE